ncbi:MAG: helix-turn-helix domain-containing protein [Actinomycetota bacterium]|jgi:transcriptional regulator with XRE-family HTH domain
MGEVVSIGERLKSHREELGMSQAQAARELDVARTAYRLWEMEAAKPAPDRWRLIARWLGVSVATMLLAEELIDEAEASAADQVAKRLASDGVAWDTESDGERGNFFNQERSKIQDQEASGRISEVESTQLADVLARLEGASNGLRSSGWRRGSLRKELPRTEAAPALARAAVAVTAAGVPAMQLEDALLLTSELVTNGVQHPPAGNDFLLLEVSVDKGVLRVVVTDGGSDRIRPRSPDADGGWGLTIVMETASRWGVGTANGHNTTWFELDLPAPGT